jgi:hypothetical protein
MNTKHVIKNEIPPKTRKTLTKRAIAIKKLNEHEKRKHKR